MSAITETDLIDYLAGALTPNRRGEVAAAVASDPLLQTELAELESLLADIAAAPEPEPSAAADARFATMLDRAVVAQKTGGGRAAAVRPLRSVWWRVAGVAAAVLLVFTAGRLYEGHEAQHLDQELAATRSLMLELMKDERTSARIRATTVTFGLTETDPLTIANLGYLLRNDRNTNVRLAALEALRRFPDDPGVRNELLAAMEEVPPEVVRFELIETLVRLNEQRVIPYLDDLMQTDTLPQPVRDAAQMAKFKLI